MYTPNVITRYQMFDISFLISFINYFNSKITTILKLIHQFEKQTDLRFTEGSLEYRVTLEQTN